MTRRLLLTSMGLRTPTLVAALATMLGKPFTESTLVYLPTASLAETGDKGWLVDDLVHVQGLGWECFDVIDLNGLPAGVVTERLQAADVIYAGGGNHYHLARSIAPFADTVARLLDTRVWVGLSAGSMIFSRHLHERSAARIGDLADLELLGTDHLDPPFGWFDWYLKPHLDSPAFPERTDAWAEAFAARTDFPTYFLDDASAVAVHGDRVEVVGDGRWRLLQ